jgi:acyl carrier protein
MRAVVETREVDVKSYDEIDAMLVEYLAQKTGGSAAEIDRTRRFDRMGLDSADAVRMVGEIEDFVGRPLSASLPYSYPTIEKLVRHLADSND